jgi:hypothetical protein
MRSNLVLGYLTICGGIMTLFLALFMYWVFVDPKNTIEQPRVGIDAIDEQAVYITRDLCTDQKLVLRINQSFLNIDSNRVLQLRPQTYISSPGCNSDKFSIDLPSSDGIYVYKSFAVYYLNPIMQNNIFELPDVTFKVENHAGYIITNP